MESERILLPLSDLSVYEQELLERLVDSADEPIEQTLPMDKDREVVRSLAKRSGVRNRIHLIVLYYLSRQVDSRFDNLTPKERRVAVLAASGYSNKEIGKKLHVTEDTVKTHVRSLTRKLGVRNRTQIAVYLMFQASRRELDELRVSIGLPSSRS